MRVIKAELPRASEPAASRSGFRRLRPGSRPPGGKFSLIDLELFGLAVAALVVMAGLILAYAGRVSRIDEGAPAAIVQLSALNSAADLTPLLTMYESDAERQVVADALYRRATAEPRLEHVGGLATVTMSAADINNDRRLVRLRERLAQRPTATELRVLTAADLTAIKPGLSVRTRAQYTSRVLLSAVVLIVSFLLAHLARRWRRRNDDPVLLPALLLLSGIGLMTMVGLRDPVRDTMPVGVMVWGVAMGLVALVAASEFDFEASKLRRMVIAPLGAALALALALLVFGSGPGTSGVKVNLFGAQPVEAIRLFVIFALAAFFGRRLDVLRSLSQPATPERPWLRYFRVPRWQDVRPVLASMALVLLFFFFQKDLGPALVLTCVFLALYGLGRGHSAFVLTGLGILVFGFAVAYAIGEPATVRQRVMIWADPWDNGVAGGNQIAQGLWAFATGGTWGSGPGLGSPQFVPEGHTDFVLAAIGEELGFVGLVSVIVLYGVLGWRCLRAGLRAPGDYTAFLAVGVALGLVVQALVMASALLGLIPLSGVVTPFVSFGRSSMIANCLAVGIVLAVAQRRGPVRRHLQRPVNAMASVLVIVAMVVVARAAWVQVVKADDIATAPSLTEQADGGYRVEHNPRLLAAARTLPRGTVYDRHGLPLATSRPDEIASIGATYKAAGLTPRQPCSTTDSRCYPLGGLMFHVLGDWNTQANWGAGNSSYLERDSDAALKGFDDHAEMRAVINPRTGQKHQVIMRDYHDLLPLVRQKHWPRSRAINALRARDRDVRTTIDARLQVRTARSVEQRVVAGGADRGAAVVLDPKTGDVLAAVSYPWPSVTDLADPKRVNAPSGDAASPWLDRVRYGLYPPGSVFKVLIASAALRSNAGHATSTCIRLPGGRVGNHVQGAGRPVRDDPKDTVPHGRLNLHDALVVSCNAYFAQLAQDLGPQAVFDTARLFDMDVARPLSPEGLVPTLPHAGYGQGHVVVSPFKMARVSAAVAAGGAIQPARWMTATSASAAAAPASRLITPSQAAELGRAMRDVVLDGTGRALAGHPGAIAGKTGTAEVEGKAAHAWFTGFAPYGARTQSIAFAVLVEHAGYGARSAGPIAGEIVTAARDLGIIK